MRVGPEVPTGLWLVLDRLVYQCNSTIAQVPAVVLRPVFGWKPVEMFSADEDERLRPAADVSLP